MSLAHTLKPTRSAGYKAVASDMLAAGRDAAAALAAYMPQFTALAAQVVAGHPRLRLMLSREGWRDIERIEQNLRTCQMDYRLLNGHALMTDTGLRRIRAEIEAMKATEETLRRTLRQSQNNRTDEGVLDASQDASQKASQEAWQAHEENRHLAFCRGVGALMTAYGTALPEACNVICHETSDPQLWLAPRKILNFLARLAHFTEDLALCAIDYHDRAKNIDLRPYLNDHFTLRHAFYAADQGGRIDYDLVRLLDVSEELNDKVQAYDPSYEGLQSSWLTPKRLHIAAAVYA